MITKLVIISEFPNYIDVKIKNIFSCLGNIDLLLKIPVYNGDI